MGQLYEYGILSEKNKNGAKISPQPRICLKKRLFIQRKTAQTATNNDYFLIFLERKLSISAAISLPWSSNAKCPALSKWNSRFLRSRL